MSEIQNKPAAPAGNTNTPRPAGSNPRPAGTRPFIGTARPAGTRPAFRSGPRPAGAGGSSTSFAGGQKRRIVRGDKTTDGKPNENNRGGRSERPRSEYDQKMIDIRRVTRVVSGGRRMSFAVALVIGDKKGLVGLGTGKGADTAIAIAKALKQAKKGLIKLNLTDKMSLPHEVSAKFNASRVTIRPNNAKGMVAGSSIRDILTLAGIHNVTGKLNSGSKNKLSNARAAMKALSTIGKPAPVYTTASSDAFTS
jgi:small subunit ribosomal protein S5